MDPDSLLRALTVQEFQAVLNDHKGYLTAPFRIEDLGDDDEWEMVFREWRGPAIYFVQHWSAASKCESWHGRIKMGFSMRPRARIEELVCQFWGEDQIALRGLLHTTPRPTEEQRLHKIIAQSRIAREWYRPDRIVHALAEWRGPLPATIDEIYRRLEASSVG